MERDLAGNASCHPQRIVFAHGLKNCSFPESDLPIIHPLFVGREDDVRQVMYRVTRAHIVNINGAPGFGKSTLAIHVGYEFVKNRTSVRYINIEDKVVSQMQKFKGKAKHIFDSKPHSHRAQKSSLIEISRSSLSTLRSGKLRIESENLFEELQQWSEKIYCTSILILDNCDDILISTSRYEFLNLINLLVTKSRLRLHIIIVSCERLLFLDSFDYWTVRELNQLASVDLLDKIAPAIDNESLRAVAELVEGCPLALKVIGQLLHINGVQLIHKVRKELITILDKASVPEQRFRMIMDVAFNRLGILKDCGYMLSLFPGSFDERTGNAIVYNYDNSHDECLETFLKHSLLNDFYLAFNYRYKIHRLIKEYLQEKFSTRDNTTFVTRFKKHFVTLLLIHAIKQEIDDDEKYTLSLDLHNFDHLKKILMSDIHPSTKELAAMAFLFDIKLIQLEELYRYSALYIKNIREVHLYLNPKLYGQLYTNIVKYLYQQCKCETLTAYIQNFIVSPCMEHFQCEVVTHLQSLYTFGLFQLSDNESSFIDLIIGLHCSRGYYSTSFISSVFLMFTSLIKMGFMWKYSTNIDLMIIRWAWVPIAYGLYEYALTIYKFDIKVAPHLRILEITTKWLCHYVIIFIGLFIMYTAISRSSIRISFFVVLPTFIMYIIIYKEVSVTQYCCQLIPLCV